MEIRRRQFSHLARGGDRRPGASVDALSVSLEATELIDHTSKD
jgi:hypothetical protein